MAGRFCGHSNPDLNPAGELQSLRVADEVAGMGIARIYSSDLLRASRTAIAIGQRTGLSVEFQPNLREIDFGLWEGYNWREIEDRFPNEAACWMDEFPLRSAPGGEAYAAFTARIDSAIAPLLRGSIALQAALVTHRGVMRYALTKFFGFSDDEAWIKTAPYGSVVIATPRRKGEDL
jgi:broad specificity phosphatase PhoE